MSEAGKHLYLHELSLAPKERLCRTKKLLSPEPDLGEENGMLEHFVSATWAPDDTLVCLQYSIKCRGDARQDETGRFQVSEVSESASWLHTALHQCTGHQDALQSCTAVLGIVNAKSISRSNADVLLYQRRHFTLWMWLPRG